MMIYDRWHFYCNWFNSVCIGGATSMCIFNVVGDYTFETVNPIHNRNDISIGRGARMSYVGVSGMRRLQHHHARERAARSEPRSAACISREWLAAWAPRQCYFGRRAVCALVDYTLSPSTCSRQTVSTRHSLAKVCAMIYKWEPTSDARVTLIAHGELVRSWETFETRQLWGTGGARRLRLVHAGSTFPHT